jgi:hypothetical protein
MIIFYILLIIFNIKFLKFYNYFIYKNIIFDITNRIKHLFSKSQCIIENNLKLCKIQDEYYYVIPDDISIGSKSIQNGYI